jgi:hypothetical protein
MSLIPAKSIDASDIAIQCIFVTCQCIEYRATGQHRLEILQYNILMVLDIAINILLAGDIAIQYIDGRRYCNKYIVGWRYCNTIYWWWQVLQSIY